MAQPSSFDDPLDPSSADVLAEPLDFFDRWERQQWSLGDLDLAADRDHWASLRPFTRTELRDGIDGFLLGESAVSETLAPLVDAAPSDGERAFLATQLVDEARHTLFFFRYITQVEGAEPEPWAIPTDSLTELLDDELRRATTAVREAPQDRDAWYRSVVIYHLLVEGVMAVSGLRSLLQGLRRVPALEVLAAGLANIARDESRHISFGVSALRTGVANGYGDAILAALRDSTPLAVRALVRPEQRFPRLLPEEIRRAFGEQRQRLWGLAEAALLGRVGRIGFDEVAVGEVRELWREARDSALDRYRELHESDHPARLSAERELSGPAR